MSIYSSRAYLMGELARMRIDIELRTFAGERSKSLSEEALRYLQTAVQLKALVEGRMQ